jgi:hypothetical protein
MKVRGAQSGNVLQDNGNVWSCLDSHLKELLIIDRVYYLHVYSLYVIMPLSALQELTLTSNDAASGSNYRLVADVGIKRSAIDS